MGNHSFSASVVTLRAALLVDVAVTWGHLLTNIVEAYEVTSAGTETRSELTSAYSDAGDASEASWLTYRLLWDIPWSARDVPYSASLVGARSTSTPQPARFPPTGRLWVTWSSKWTRRFGEALADLLIAAWRAPPSPCIKAGRCPRPHRLQPEARLTPVN